MFTLADTRTERLASKLVCADGASATLLAEIVAANPRLMTLKAMGKTGRLDRLVTCEAWTEAAMELLALGAPGWSVKRLCRDDGEWLCTLTRIPDLPDWLDDSIEGRHPVLALAIVDALIGIRTRDASPLHSVTRQERDVDVDCADYR